jgi:hypothetical protein
MYPAVADGVVTTRLKLRLCGPHFRGRMLELRSRAQNAQLELEEEAENKCFFCGEPVEDGHAQLYVTVYDSGEDREDFWAPLHDSHVALTCEMWHLPAGVP